MKTIINTIHEEQYGDDGRILGVLGNFNSRTKEKVDSFIYTYKDETYIIFDTITDMLQYLLYGDHDVRRSYIKENKFDEHYDNPMNGLFKDIIEWM